jgi:HSP20 family molecular chaperone IbpA
MIALNSSIDKVFDSALSEFFSTFPATPAQSGLSYQVKESADGHSILIEVEVPGVNPEEIRVDAKGRAVVVECPRGSTYLTVGSRVDLDHIQARVKWGMLTIEVPRRDTKSVSVQVVTEE